MVKGLKPDAKLDERIIDCVDRVLARLGGAIKETIYHHLERMGLSKEEIPDRPGEFVIKLRRILGAVAAMLEREIIKELVYEFRLKEEPRNLEDAVVMVRRMYRSR